MNFVINTLLAVLIAPQAHAVMQPDECYELLAPMGIAPNHLASKSALSTDQIHEAKQNIEPAFFLLPHSLNDETQQIIGNTADAVRFLDNAAEKLMAQLPMDIRSSIRKLYQNDIVVSNKGYNAYRGRKRYYGDLVYGQVLAIDQEQYRIHWNNSFNKMPVISRLLKIKALILDLALQRQLLWLDHSGARYRHFYGALDLHIAANSYAVLLDLTVMIPFSLIHKELFNDITLADQERLEIETYFQALKTGAAHGAPISMSSAPGQPPVDLKDYLEKAIVIYQQHKINTQLADPVVPGRAIH